MTWKRLFIAALFAATGVWGEAFAQNNSSATSSSSSSAPPCEDACCFKQSKDESGKIKFECVSNWCQEKCELVYPKGADGKPDLNKKPGCGCQAAPPPQPPPTDLTNCRDGAGVCQEGRECVGKVTKKKGKCAFNVLRGGCYCETGGIISNPISSVQSSVSSIRNVLPR